MVHLLAMVEEEVVFTVMSAAALVLVIGFVTVLLVKSIPSKLILFGLLLAVAAMLVGCFWSAGVILPATVLILAVFVSGRRFLSRLRIHRPTLQTPTDPSGMTCAAVLSNRPALI